MALGQLGRHAPFADVPGGVLAPAHIDAVLFRWSAKASRRAGFGPFVEHAGAQVLLLLLGQLAGHEPQFVDVGMPAAGGAGQRYLDGAHGAHKAKIGFHGLPILARFELALGHLQTALERCQAGRALVRKRPGDEVDEAARRLVLFDQVEQLFAPMLRNLGRAHRAGPHRAAHLQVRIAGTLCGLRPLHRHIRAPFGPVAHASRRAAIREGVPGHRLQGPTLQPVGRLVLLVRQLDITAPGQHLPYKRGPFFRGKKGRVFRIDTKGVPGCAGRALRVARVQLVVQRYGRTR